MTLAVKNHAVNLRHGPSAEDSSFRLPNPGDVFLLVTFMWSVLCFFLVVGDQRIVARLARFISSNDVRQVLLTQQSAIAVVMIVGVGLIALTFYLLNRYKYISLGVFIFSMSFASALWAPVYYISFACKYLVIVYLGAYGLLFLIHNGWRLIAMPYHRLLLVYLAWLGLVVLINGFKIPDVWYLGTEFVMMIGFAIAWLAGLDSRNDVRRFNVIFAYAGIAATVVHLMSPVVWPEFTQSGRFVSVFNRATGFSVSYSLFVAALFWLAMYEKRPGYRQIFLVIATIGFGLILWSGTRNAVASTLIAIAVLWWVFRTRIFIYIGIVGVIGALVQAILGGVEDVSYLSERLQSTTNTRLEVWALYWSLALQSPVFGYGPTGLSSAVFGEQLAGLMNLYGRARVPGVHNFYLGLAARFGFVGLGIVLLLFFLGFLRAARVILSKTVSLEDKQVYVLPVVLLLMVALHGLFEDTIGSTGKGTLHSVAFVAGLAIVWPWGTRLLRGARPADA